MYPIILTLHSWLRWGVVFTLTLTLLVSLLGWFGNRTYTKSDALLRSVTTSVAHLQLLIGFILYFKSPITAYFQANFRQALSNQELTFFGLIHLSVMLIAVVVLTFGSSLGKRATTDREKHRIVSLYFLTGAILIAIAIPWPFSPLAQRPLIPRYLTF